MSCVASNYGSYPRTMGARSLILRRWITRKIFHNGQEICEIEVDGAARVIAVSDIDDPSEDGVIYWRDVAEGNEVGPWGCCLNMASCHVAGVGRQGATASTLRRDEGSCEEAPIPGFS